MSLPVYHRQACPPRLAHTHRGWDSHPKNYLAEEHIETIARLYHDWRAEEGLSAIITNEEAARNDYNLSPSRYVASNDREEVLPLEEAMVLLREAEEERAEAERHLHEVLEVLGLQGKGT